MGNTGKRVRKRYIALGFLLAYIVVCQSCMTMRSTPRETATFFGKAKVAYLDAKIWAHGHPVHYIETGSPKNPTLLFVHGSPGSWNAFQRYLSDPLLLKKYRMIAVDRPGFGYSDFGEARDLATNSEWISEVARQTKNGRPVILVGHSLGGPLIAKMAADHPALFDKLVILSGSVDPDLEKAERWRNWLKTPPLRYLVPGALRPSNDELSWLRRDLVLLRPQLRSISAHVTVIHGTKDPLVPFANAAFLQKELVNAASVRVVPIEGANHFIPWERYSLIRDELLR